MWHNLKMALTQLLVFTIGLFFLANTPSHIVFSMLLALILSITYIRIVKFFEYQADQYAARNMSSPQGMISGNIKMKKVNRTLDGNKYLQWMFVCAVPYDERIKIAQKEIERRKVNKII